MRILGRSFDIGHMWGRWLYTYSQAGSVQGGINTLMLLVITYNTSINGAIPVWVYMLTIVLVLVTLIWFVSKIGIPGYFKFYKEQSAVGYLETEVRRQGEVLDAIKTQLDKLTGEQ